MQFLYCKQKASDAFETMNIKKDIFRLVQKYDNKKKTVATAVWHVNQSKELFVINVKYTKEYYENCQQYRHIGREEKKQFFIRDFLRFFFLFLKKKVFPLVLRRMEIDGRRKSIRKIQRKFSEFTKNNTSIHIERKFLAQRSTFTFEFLIYVFFFCFNNCQL